MKKRVYFFFSFFLLLPLLSFGETGTEFYSSDEIGMAIEKIPWYRTDEYEYVLKVITMNKGNGGVAEKTLLKNGKEIKRWKIFYSGRGIVKRRLYYEGKNLESEEIFDSRGRIISRKEFKSSELLDFTRYTYVGNVLKQREKIGMGGTKLWTDFFSYDKWGRLIRVVRVFPDGRREVSLYNIGDSGLYDELQGFKTRVIVFHYDSKGREIEREEWKGSKLLSNRNTRYYGDSSKRKLVRVTYPEDKKEIIENYSSDGLLIKKEELVSGEIVSEEDYTWRKDLLIRKQIREKGKGIELYLYFYDASKKLTREEHWVKGEMESVKKYTGEGSMVESFYMDGKVFLRRYYLKGRKTREEIIENGKVIRERKFE